MTSTGVSFVYTICTKALKQRKVFFFIFFWPLPIAYIFFPFYATVLNDNTSGIVGSMDYIFNLLNAVDFCCSIIK